MRKSISSRIAVIILLLPICFFELSCQKKTWIEAKDKEASSTLDFFLHDTIGRESLRNITLIPDEETAIDIAEPILFKLYGKSRIIQDRPYRIKRISNYWILTGTFPPKNHPKMAGGTFEIVLDASDARVVGVIHWK